MRSKVACKGLGEECNVVLQTTRVRQALDGWCAEPSGCQAVKPVVSWSLYREMISLSPGPPWRRGGLLILHLTGVRHNWGP